MNDLSEFNEYTFLMDKCSCKYIYFHNGDYKPLVHIGGQLSIGQKPLNQVLDMPVKGCSPPRYDWETFLNFLSELKVKKELIDEISLVQYGSTDYQGVS